MSAARRHALRFAADSGWCPARVCVLAILLLTGAGCASLDPYAVAPMSVTLERDDAVGYCARLFADIDRRIDALGVRDAESARIAGFPYLRVDRFSAALARRSGDDLQESAWRARLLALDEAARKTELANADLSIDDLQRCRAMLAEADASASGQLHAAATVPDNYSLTMRTLGVYPLARVPFAAGVTRWQTATRSVFATPLDALPVRGAVRRYVPEQRPLETQPRLVLDPLGVPVLTAAQTEALLMRHAPVLEVDVAASYDEPGTLILDSEDRAVVEGASPVAYTRFTYTTIGAVIHPQLVYTFWFSERPASGELDLLSGRLDGLVWRVTLDADGEPLVYDSMHACGCYHMFFPTDKVVARDLPVTLDESLFVPQAVRGPRGGERVTLRVESGTHYLQRVQVMQTTASPAPPRKTDAITYSMQDERILTTLRRPTGGTRSAYGSDGLMAGSERSERWLFWPMGIVSAGQMRQWGHHATAFVGRRHFDDPFLFDTYFEMAGH
ncbi:MAG: hypothetical protein ABJA83_00765 [Burkholderiaceae bacterium]